MNNVTKIFRIDVRHLFANVVNVIVTLGLALLPSLFAWYNVIACWDVFDNTGNVKVAVANTDEGYESDLVPLRVNLGEQVVSALRANDQIEWEFVSQDEAVDGARAGRYYAAVVIPPSFSQDMLTFYVDDKEHAKITYFSNEKKNVIAPKVTDQSATTIAYQVDEAFAEAVSGISLSVVHVMSHYLDESGADVRVEAMAQHFESVATQLDQTAEAVSMFGTFVGASQSTLDASYALVDATQQGIQETSKVAKDAIEGTSGAATAVASASEGMKQALDAGVESYVKLEKAAKEALSTVEGVGGDAAKTMREQAKLVGNQIAGYQAMADLLRTLAPQLPTDFQGAATATATRMDTAVGLLQNVKAHLEDGAAALEKGQAQAKEDRAELERLASEAKSELEALSKRYDEELKPALKTLEDSANSAADAFTAGLDSLAQAQVAPVGDGTPRQLMADALTQMDQASNKLHDTAGQLRETGGKLRQAAVAGDSQTLRDLLQADVEGLSSALAAPVGVERVAVFPSQSFGAAMAPLYTTLALFIGSLLIMVIVKPHVSSRIEEVLDDPKPRQLFTGRFLVCSLLSTAQSVLMVAGNLFFLQMTVAHPWLLLLAYWFAGQVFTFIIYALVVSFANLGKAIAVLMLIVQVTGCGGSYPLQILPWFVQGISPWLPATHVVDAMRAATLGLYQNDFWVAMGELALFLIPAALLGYALRKPFERFMHWYVHKVESTDLIA